MHLVQLTPYTPVDAQGQPLDNPQQILFLQDANGLDWYEQQSHFAADSLKVVVNTANQVVSAHVDVSALWPLGCSVYEIALEQVPDPFQVEDGWYWQDQHLVRAQSASSTLTEEQLAEGRKRWRAQQHIVAIYPEWQQLNLLRSGDMATIKRMGRFIDAVRAWSNDPKSTEHALQKIKP